MNRQKYRKLYLRESGFKNRFIMKKHTLYNRNWDKGWRNLDIGKIMHHSKPRFKNSFWINDHQLCIGYELIDHPEIFRPVFSYKRQNILDRVNKEIYNHTNFWNKHKYKYFKEICKIKKLPIEISKHIVEFIY